MMKFILSRNEKPVPRALDIYCEPWQREVYSILKREGIKEICIQYKSDDLCKK